MEAYMELVQVWMFVGILLITCVVVGIDTWKHRSEEY